jgi:hypothetical protein
MPQLWRIVLRHAHESYRNAVYGCGMVEEGLELINKTLGRSFP